jgi:hypothetical protein
MVKLSCGGWVSCQRALLGVFRFAQLLQQAMFSATGYRKFQSIVQCNGSNGIVANAAHKLQVDDTRFIDLTKTMVVQNCLNTKQMVGNGILFPIQHPEDTVIAIGVAVDDLTDGKVFGFAFTIQMNTGSLIEMK